MAEIAAQGTERGTILLTVTSDAGQRGQAELSADQAEDLKAQLGTALLAVRMRQIEAVLASLPKQPPPRGDRCTRRCHQSGVGFPASSGGVDWKQTTLSAVRSKKSSD